MKNIKQYIPYAVAALAVAAFAVAGAGIGIGIGAFYAAAWVTVGVLLGCS